MTEIAYGQYAEAYKVIHQALLSVQAVAEKIALDSQGKIAITGVDTSALLKTSDLNIDPDRHLQADVVSLPTVTGVVSVNDLLSGFSSPPAGKAINKWAFSWNADGSIATLKAYQDSELLFTLTCSYDAGVLQNITRS